MNSIIYKRTVQYDQVRFMPHMKGWRKNSNPKKEKEKDQSEMKGPDHRPGYTLHALRGRAELI